MMMHSLGGGLATPSPATCEWCFRPLGPRPPSAPHKRFCNTSCRNKWHWKARSTGLAEGPLPMSPEEFDAGPQEGPA